jgi:Fe-S-cluster containining protein
MSICSECGGECCKAFPGIFHPEDFQDVEKEYNPKIMCLDWWEGYYEDTDVHMPYFIRMRCVSDGDRMSSATWGGECVNLGKRGCKLPRKRRAAQCIQLVASADGNCTIDEKYTKVELVRAWLPYQEQLKKIREGNNV